VKFVSIVKPGIIFGNIVTVCGGFFLGSQGLFSFPLLLETLLGMALIIACGCVLNNIIDIDIDSLMERTKHRPLVKGLMSKTTAFIYAIILGILGFLVLIYTTNWLTTGIAFVGLFFYVVVYSLALKRKSSWGTAVGGISGAVPPVVGYCAVTGSFDAGAIILFLILFFWQMPHFYAIGIYRLSDYTAASIPILPIKKNIPYTKIVMLFYTLAFTIAAISPSLFGYTGYAYFIVALILGCTWFYYGWQGLKATNDKIWARKMFLFSIINITVLCIMMAVKI
jgi:protoheme IX farnesyltransferase